MSPANISIYDYMGDRNERNIFLSPVNEDEVIRVVRMCANKNSSDAGLTTDYVKHGSYSFVYICAVFYNVFIRLCSDLYAAECYYPYTKKQKKVIE